MFEDSTLSIILGSTKPHITRELLKLHNLELNVLNVSRNIVVVIKSRRMRSAGHVAGIGEE